jgi:hypothetical protein
MLKLILKTETERVGFCGREFYGSCEEDNEPLSSVKQRDSFSSYMIVILSWRSQPGGVICELT